LNDPSHKDAITLGDAHNHPQNPALSEQDVRAMKRWRPSRVAVGAGQVSNRGTMMFFRDKRTGKCNAVLFDNQSLTVSALHNGKWLEIGTVLNDQGHIQLHDGMDWLSEQ
jgi:hypothetical protein